MIGDKQRGGVLGCTIAGLLLVAAACGGEGSKVFGEQSAPCQPIELTNDVDDDQRVSDGTACFMAEYEAGRAVTWDVLQVTVEGDPIPTRYAFDGSTVTITTDISRDEFGAGGVREERCDGARRTNWLPEGVDCTSSGGDGFRSESLPGG